MLRAGGPKYLIGEGVTGFTAETESALAELTFHLMSTPEAHLRMREAARDAALKMSWSRAFEEVYRAYDFATARSIKEAA